MIDSPHVLMRRYGLSARKTWGQNFLHARSVVEAIVAASGANPGVDIVEIGAGLGTLTAPLLETGAWVCALERDRDLCVVLRKELGASSNIEIRETDAVRFDYGECVRMRGRVPTIVGNLPYHLSGPLLFALLEHHARTGPWIVMVQKELGDRLRAAPGSRRYGGVTVALSRLRSIRLVVPVSAGCFVPAPRVDSVVLRFDPRAQPLGDVPDSRAFLELVRTVFQQRRKTLANALSQLGDRERALHWCAVAGVDPQIRPEHLDPAAFAALERARANDARS